MFCSTCGTQSTAGLSYCKRCGANLEASQGKGDKPGVASGLMGLFWGLAVLAIGGVSAVLALGIPLVALGMKPSHLLPLMGAGMLVIAGTIAFLMVQLSRLITISARETQPSHQRPVIAQPQPYQLAQPPASISSVTEHTTRSLEPNQYGNQKVDS